MLHALKRNSVRPLVWGLMLLPLALTACGETKQSFPERRKGESQPTWSDQPQEDGLFGPGGLTLFGGKKKDDEPGSGIGVNAYLWRASLDTIAFMPISSADPFGGVILTDWYAPPETPDERLKVTVFIMDRALRADGVRVSVFRQQHAKDGTWKDVAVDQATVTELENTILTRARQLRINSAQ